MSRARMLYEDKPLESIPVTPVRWETEWKPEQLFRMQSHGSVIVEGILQRTSRFSVSDSYSGPKKWRYVVLHVEILKAFKRKFDLNTGKEIEPNYGKDKKVSTGYLMSSFKTSAAEESDKISASEVIKMTTVSELKKIMESKLPGLSSNTQAFWYEEEDMKNMELVLGDHLRLKSKGEGPFIESIAKLDDESSMVTNYAGGEGVGTSWTDKVMSFKGQQDVPQDEGVGDDDDEWDD